MARIERFDVPHELLIPDPSQVRKKKAGIASLAESIDRYGLLENLVAKRGTKSDTFDIVAGERRWLAIGKLIEEGRWFKKKPVPVVLIEGDGIFENLVENIERLDVAPWELGRRFSELVESGYTQRQVAEQLGKNQGYVSRHITIAHGVAPETVEFINKLNLKLTANDLLKLAGLVNKHGEPQPEAQIAAVKKLQGVRSPHRNRRPPNKNVLGEKEQVYLRYKRLQMSAGVPPHALPYMQSILRYLSGEDRRLRFRL